MILKFTNYLMIAVFALAAVVQYNDANAVRWMLVYGAAFIISLRFTLGKLHWATAAALSGVCTVWVLFKIPQLSASGFQHMLDEVQMMQTGVQAAREFLGLLIIAGWVTVLAVSTYRKRNELDGTV